MADEAWLRAPGERDVDTIAQVWHQGWRDGHLDHVPAALLPYRTVEHFRARVPPRLANTTLGMLAGAVVGLVVVHDDELEQLFVLGAGRGTGLADMLLRRGEQLIAQRFEEAWLAVTSENTRARRFYEREGWHDAGALAYRAEIPGASLPVPSRRYRKLVRLTADD